MIKNIDNLLILEGYLLLVIFWILFLASFGMFMLGVMYIIFQCFYFAYHGTWPAMPTSLLFVEHRGLQTEAFFPNPAIAIPNVFNTGPWQSWIGIWKFIDFISIPALLIIISVISLILAAWCNRVRGGG
jgi:hypothetical protein